MADVITRLKVESTEYDSRIKRASQGLLQMEQACRKVGDTLAILEKDELEFVKSLGKMETVSKDARGQISELTKAFTDLSLQYKRLTDEEKQGDFGKALSSSLEQLKTRIQNTKKDLADIGQELNGSKFGQFGGIIDGIGQKMGINANLTELLTSKTALMTAGIGASVAIIGKATEAWASYNAELARQDQQAQVVTGLKGEDADRMSNAARALADTYNVDFRQAIEAANTIMAQFGRSGDEAIQLLRDGLQGMVLGDGQKLLSMIQQYGPAFQSAGVSASQLVAVIQNSEGGIFTDQNMQAIVMGIKNIRLMTKQTSDALSQLGIDGNKMSEQLNNGTLTVFDALKQVAGELKGVDSNSKAAGEVMQAVFGRQGAMAGTNIAKAIEGLNTNLAETKRQTGELGAAYADLELANERLNSAIRDCFEYDGWEQMATGIKTGLLNALSEVLEMSIKIKNSWVGELGATIFDKLSSAALETTGIFGRLLNLIRGIKEEAGDTAAPGNVGKEGAVIARMVPERIMRPSKEALELKNTDAGKRKDVHRRNLSRYDAQIAEQQQKVSALGDSSLVPEIQEAIEGEKKRLKELQQMRETYAREAEKILVPKNEVKIDTQNAATSIKELTAKLKELRAEREKARQAGDVEKVKSLDSRISTVSGDIKLLRGSIGNTSSRNNKTQTETQQNEAAIAKLTEEYQNLATAEKTADDAQKAGLSERITDIRGEIKTLQDRNAELKKFADEAKGVKVSVGVEGSLPQLTQQLKDLQQAQSQSLDTREWVEYQKQIDTTSTKIDILKGKWKEGQVATFSFEEKQPDKMVFTADNKDVLTKLAEIREAVGGIEIDEKSLTVTANTAEAVEALRKIDGLTIQPKDVSFLADNAEVLDKLREVNGVSIDDKRLTVTANTAEAVEALRKIDGLTIQPKDVSFLADNAEVLDKLREVNGVSIDDKRLTVTANTAEAYNKVQELIGGIEGTSVSFEVKPDITYTDANMQAFLSDLKKQVQQAELGSELYNNLTAQLADANALANLMQVAIKNGIDVSQFNPQDLWKKVFSENPGDYISNEQWKEIETKINEELKKMGIEPIQLNFETGGLNTIRSQAKGISDLGEDISKSWGNAASSISSIGSALNSIQDPAAQVAGLVANAIATIAQTFAKSLSGTATPWDWIAGAVAGTATMISTIAAIKTATSGNYAEGGIVPGNNFSGDNVRVYGLNSGELILNKAQQNTIAAELTSRDIGAGYSYEPVTISSENIRIIMRNGARRRGMSVAEYLEL